MNLGMEPPDALTRFPTAIANPRARLLLAYGYLSTADKCEARSDGRAPWKDYQQDTTKIEIEAGTAA